MVRFYRTFGALLLVAAMVAVLAAREQDAQSPGSQDEQRHGAEKVRHGLQEAGEGAQEIADDISAELRRRWLQDTQARANMGLILWPDPSVLPVRCIDPVR